MKRCASCGEAKPHEAFYRLTRSKDGLQGYCKACSNAKRLDWKRRNPEREREWAKAGRERRSPDRRRHRDLRSKFKMGIDDYRAMLAAQGGVCAGCGDPPAEGKSLHVDHDHSCCPSSRKTCGECVRGLLCFRCNGALGNVGDSRQVLQALIAYLDRTAPLSRVGSADSPAPPL